MRLRVLDFMIDNGADPNIKNKHGKTVWDYAVEHDGLDKLITGMPQFNGYIAQVGLACAEKDGPYRGAGFYIKFNGIEKIYSAHRDTGHGYGIEIKIN